MKQIQCQHRLIIASAIRGNIGKSTTISLIAQWLDLHAITWNGVDWDADHSTFSRLFPDRVQLIPIGQEPVGDIIKELRNLSESTLSVWDPRAHFSDSILEAWRIVRFQSAFAKDSGRITVLLFPSDDVDVLTNIDQCFQELGNSVDYIIVKNRAKAPKTKMFDGSAIESDLLNAGAQTLEIPALLSLARNHLAALEATLERGVTHSEAVSNKDLKLDPMIRHIIEDWLQGIFRSLDVLAPLLVPDSFLNKIPKSSTTAGLSVVQRGAKINRKNL